MSTSPLFTGASSLRDPTERLAFWLTLIFALPAAAALGFFIHEEVGMSQIALFVVGAMLYVTLARGRLLGSSVMIHEAQYPRVFAIVKRACAALEIPMPLVFVREDYFVPVATMGFGEPYALVLSTHWIELFADDELAFVIGRHLGHIAAGHTRFYSLLSVNGNENPFIALIFGAWLRRCELTCDKVGLLVCGSLDAATRALAVSSFHRFGRNVNLAQFAEQGQEIRNDGVLRMGEWLGAEPYATKRIAHMERFAQSHAFQVAEDWFLREHSAEPPLLPSPGSTSVQKADCAGWWRRVAAFSIDFVVVGAILSAFQPTLERHVIHLDTSSLSPQSADQFAQMLKLIIFASNPIWFFSYLALLVAFTGQSFGMMITGLRVVTLDYRRPSVARSLLRYAVGAVLSPFIILASPFRQRIMLHDKLSKTRLIAAERIMARTVTQTV